MPTKICKRCGDPFLAKKNNILYCDKCLDYMSTRRSTKRPRCQKYVWYARAPHYRLTHLLAKGHATKNGGRTRADPFLQNAIDEVIPEYEREIKEVLSNGK